MRTTLTLNNDLAERLQRAAAKEGKPFQEVLNDTLRAGLSLREKQARRTEKFMLRTFRSHLKAGIDETKLNQLVDQLEAESFLGETFPAGRRS